MMSALDSTSTRPYLIRALYEWCTDNGLTPYIAVVVDERVQVPREFVQNGEIVLNISFDATSSLKLGNDFVEFKARFGGVAREIIVPMDRIIAIYARENGQGMAFPIATPGAAPVEESASDNGETDGSVTALVAPEPARGGIQLVPSPEPEGTQDTDPEPPAPASPGKHKRPALKRIK
ncbi:ClpXP protease specificity-enhancing factor [Ottowia thiooxydans]|uniref:ClpXP protease specificity-enhancing factor n=1 Tax=Ottowia thiooxydans TaxID=219182 RepID=UPI00040F5327|nr:ClpXP protease specificity-enhancing factor [Ottowia thiooxydans]